MVRAVERIPRFNRGACRQVAEARFSRRALVDAYEALYDEVAVAGGMRVRRSVQAGPDASAARADR